MALRVRLMNGPDGPLWREVASKDRGSVQRAMKALGIKYRASAWVRWHRKAVTDRLMRKARRRLLPWKVLQNVVALLLMSTAILLVVRIMDSLPLEGHPWLWLGAAAVCVFSMLAALYAVHRWFHYRYQRRLDHATAIVTWRTYELEQYRGTLPDTTVKLVEDIRRLAPGAEFEVEVIHKPLYLLLAVRTIGRRYVIDVHGPPNYDD